ncbi:replication restart helicase PriA [Arcicella lustrica]|uniref:Replication restart protein PriA n=1 Tax=Arcicella lustrica TaxID=2984196 RepID=A0ABU5SE76_9BACT|nr:primosomal protein N' [Arcicella sp. DC25W]MEA5425583.1 primosomal protein N' [Arcicella sp. DC25W]
MQSLEINQTSLYTEEITLFADVIVPVAVPNTFTYRVPREYAASITAGLRVIVQFGKTKVVTAVIARIHNKPPEKYQAKYILEVLDDAPLVNAKQIELFYWIADYYMCTVGEVLNIALPSGLKISSLSKVQFNPEFDQPALLTERETEIIEELKKHQSLNYDELARFAEVKNVYHIIKSLIQKKAVIVFEEVREKYTPKILKKIRLNHFYEDPSYLTALIGELEKSPKQLDVILNYLKFVPVLRTPELNKKGLEKNALTKANVSESSLSTLLKNGILEQFEVIVSRFEEDLDFVEAPTPVLSESQEKAFSEIMQSFQTKDTTLLHGITGSGKTEVYIKLIEQVLESGSQVLYLLPEIALTTQIVVRLRKVFGDKMGIYHSRFSDNERVEVWKGVVSGKFQFVVGVRSAVFLPFDNLGLIIVDEEHETSYKQFDPAPRYHARDVAVVIAHRQKAKVLLGSATPSIESFYNAKTERYGFVEMKERFGNTQLPDIELIDIKVARKQKLTKGDFSNLMLDTMGLNLEKKQQTILFQNRRGYSPYIQCEDCDTIAACPNCDVSLTYHYSNQELRCHYCGHHEPMSKTCQACGSTKLKTRGYGTEKLEEELQIFLPNAKIARMDLDTTRTKTAFQTLINEVESGAVDILVGTQMVSKGLDFEKVSLVCIFDADRMIHFPDFRSSERAFQMLTQVAGRAGRRGTQGKVLIQTNNPKQKILQQIIENDYLGLYQDEIKEREDFQYPPFTRIIKITLRHIDQPNAEKAAQALAQKLIEKLGTPRVLGPEKPLVERVRNQYLFEIMIKLEKTINLKGAKAFIAEQVQNIELSKDFKGVGIVVDVDCG